jgi:DNA primase
MNSVENKRQDILETVNIDVEELLGELEAYWQDNPAVTYNPTAFQRVKDSGDNIMCCCPFHVENNPSFGILREYPYTSFCFQCGQGWNLPQLVAHALNLPTEVHGEHWLITQYLTLVGAERPKLDIEALLDKTASDRRCSHLDSEIAQFKDCRHPYLYSRGFTERTLQKYEVGYDARTNTMVIPVRTSDGRLRFVKRRFVEKKGFLNETNVDKKDIVYGLYYIKQAQKPITQIALNESETDTMSCYQGGIPAGALLGKLLFEEQVRELVLGGIKVVDLFLDNDKWGVLGALRAYDMITKLSPIRVNAVMYPCARYGIDTMDETEIAYKDANDLLKANRLKEIERIPFEFYRAKLNSELKLEKRGN